MSKVIKKAKDKIAISEFMQKAKDRVIRKVQREFENNNSFELSHKEISKVSGIIKDIRYINPTTNEIGILTNPYYAKLIREIRKILSSEAIMLINNFAVGYKFVIDAEAVLQEYVESTNYELNRKNRWNTISLAYVAKVKNKQIVLPMKKKKLLKKAVPAAKKLISDYRNGQELIVKDLMIINS